MDGFVYWLRSWHLVQFDVTTTASVLVISTYAKIHSHMNLYWNWNEIIKFVGIRNAILAMWDAKLRGYSAIYPPHFEPCKVFDPAYSSERLMGIWARSFAVVIKLYPWVWAFQCVRYQLSLSVMKTVNIVLSEWIEPTTPTISQLGTVVMGIQCTIIGGLAALMYWWTLVGIQISSSVELWFRLQISSGLMSLASTSNSCNCLNRWSISSKFSWRISRILFTKLMKSCRSDGTPWSGQAKYCSCRTIRYSPVCRGCNRKWEIIVSCNLRCPHFLLWSEHLPLCRLVLYSLAHSCQ